MQEKTELKSLVNSKFNLQAELINLFKNMKWNIKCILDEDGNEIPVPKNSTCVTAILEQEALLKIQKWASPHGITVIPARNTREYPDSSLEGGPLGNKLIALDIKTSRRKNKDSISGFTIGSYAGYFVSFNEQKPGCRIPYGNFSEHWIIGFIYDWDDQLDTRNMVSNIETIVAEKWRIASKSTGTGTTKHIGSIRNIARIRGGQSVFNNEKEFHTYWSTYKSVQNKKDGLA